MIVTSFFDIIPISFEAFTFSCILPFNESAFANKPSIESYSAINF